MALLGCKHAEPRHFRLQVISHRGIAVMKYASKNEGTAKAQCRPWITSGHSTECDGCPLFPRDCLNFRRNRSSEPHVSTTSFLRRGKRDRVAANSRHRGRVSCAERRGSGAHRWRLCDRSRLLRRRSPEPLHGWHQKLLRVGYRCSPTGRPEWLGRREADQGKRTGLPHHLRDGPGCRSMGLTWCSQQHPHNEALRASAASYRGFEPPQHRNAASNVKGPFGQQQHETGQRWIIGAMGQKTTLQGDRRVSQGCLAFRRLTFRQWRRKCIEANNVGNNGKTHGDSALSFADLFDARVCR
jgi:hypothetical protein